MDADRSRHGVANPEPLAPEATIAVAGAGRNGDRAALERLLERVAFLRCAGGLAGAFAAVDSKESSRPTISCRMP